MRTRFYQKKYSKKGKWIPPRSTARRSSRIFEPHIETESGLMVRSNLEREVVSLFEELDIEHQYEPLMLLAGKQFRPDFYLPKYNLFIEICGFNHMPYYIDRNERKKRLYVKYGMNAVFVNYDKKRKIRDQILETLANLNISI